MLEPTNRLMLVDALRPPEGHTLDVAVGTTFTLDLDALLREATPADILEARRALQLVTARRSNRGKDLQATLEHFLSRLEG